MPKTREKKQELVKEYLEKFNNQKSVAFANFSGLTVKDVENLRKLCRKNGVDYLVAKKNLLKIALKEKGLNNEIEGLENNIGVGFSKDEISAAKAFSEYSKEHSDNFNILAGVLENAIIGKEKVKDLAALPSKKELLAKAVGSIKAPISNFVNVLGGNIRGLVNVLNAVKDNK